MNKGDILRVDLGNPPGGSGREQAGIRPAIAASSGDLDFNNPMITVIPLTGSKNAQRFPHTLTIQPDENNGLSVESIAMVFQLRSLDKRRVVGTMGSLEINVIEQIDNLIRGMLDL